MMKLNIYHLTRKDDGGYDTYGDCIVIAETEETARAVHPGSNDWDTDAYGDIWINDETWVKKQEVIVRLIGAATAGIRPGIICARFFAS